MEKTLASIHRFLNPQVLARLGSLKLRARRVVDGNVAGAHRSPYQGFSVEFSEHREYTPGEDLRHLDWKVLGRTDKYYLKRYEDETNLTCHLILDVSESMSFRGAKASESKLDQASSIAATLAWLTLKNQDAVSLTTIDETVRDSVNPSSAAGHLQQILRVLEESTGLEKTNLRPLLEQIGSRLKRRGVIVVISDFFDDPDSVLAGLGSLRRRQHDVIAIQVLDREEINFPFQSPTRFRGMEHAASAIVDPASLAKAYRKTFHDFLSAFKRGCALQQVEYMLCCTDDDIGIRLAAFLASR